TVAGVVTTCFSLSMYPGPRSDACADTVALAPGGFESIITSWYGPWTSVAQPLSAANATARNVACRVMRNPFRCGRGAPRGTPRLGSVGQEGAAVDCRTIRPVECLRTLLGLPEHGLLEDLGDREPDLLPGRDLDGLASLRIPAHARLHLAKPEDAQARDLDGFALLDALHDRLGEIVENLIGLLAAHPTRFCELRHQLRLRHRSTSIPGWIPVARRIAPIYGSRDMSVKKTPVYQGLARYRPSARGAHRASAASARDAWRRAREGSAGSVTRGPRWRVPRLAWRDGRTAPRPGTDRGTIARGCGTGALVVQLGTIPIPIRRRGGRNSCMSPTLWWHPHFTKARCLTGYRAYFHFQPPHHGPRHPLRPPLS